MKQINIVQFAAYFPPHQGGYESHAYQRAKHRVNNKYGKVMTVTSSIGQKKQGKYETDGFHVIVLPSFEVIPTFPFPKFRQRQFRTGLKEIKKFNGAIYQTRTRFFVSSILGGVLAKLHKKKRIHIEHGVDYVKLNAQRKNTIAWLYDQTIGRIIFHRSNHVIGLSKGCKRFAQKFTQKDITVIHRGIEFQPNHDREKQIETKQENESSTINIVFVGRLVKLKGVDLIIQAVDSFQRETKKMIQLHIIGDGEERKKLEQQAQHTTATITFHGSQSKKFLENFLPQMDIGINASYQEGLPTGVVEGLCSKLIMIATNVGGTPEISDQEDLILVEPGSSEAITQALSHAITILDKRGLSQKIVASQFSWTRNIKKYYDHYLHILQGTGKK